MKYSIHPSKCHQNLGPQLWSFSRWSLSRTFSRTLYRAFPKFTKRGQRVVLETPEALRTILSTRSRRGLTDFLIRKNPNHGIMIFHKLSLHLGICCGMLDFEANPLTLMELKNSMHLIDCFLSPLPDWLCWLQRAQAPLLAGLSLGAVRGDPKRSSTNRVPRQLPRQTSSLRLRLLRCRWPHEKSMKRGVVWHKMS